MKRLSFTGLNKVYATKFVTEKHPSELIIRFKENDVFTFIRKRQFSTIDFLSSCGGILGLFAGISVLSIVELFYYFTIRIVVNAWMDWKNCKVIPIKSTSVEEAPKTKLKDTKSVLRIIQSYITFVFKESSIHGCIYIVDPIKSWLERYLANI